MPSFSVEDKAEAAVGATDPDFSKDIKTNRPVIGLTTENQDADRYGIYVPSETTTLSLGQKSAKDEKRHINDVGITGRTDNHVHFHVAKNTKTVTSLGGPATSVVIDSHDPKVPKESVGYSMVTDELAWHDSKKQHYLVSREGDVVLRAEGKTGKPTALLQSDKGFVTAMAGQGLTVAAKATLKIAVGSVIPMESKQKYDAVVEGETIKAFDTEHKKVGDAAVTQIDAVHGYFSGNIVAQTNDPVVGSGSWSPLATRDKAATLADLDKRLVAADVDASAGSDRLDIFAQGNASLHAGGHAWTYGKAKATLMSDASVSLLGNVVVASGKDAAALWGGVDASVTGIDHVAIKSVKGDLSVHADKDVNIGSETTSVKIQAKVDAQLNTLDGNVYVHGKTKAYCAGGGGTSYGMMGEASSLHAGKFSSGDNYSGAAPVADEGFMIDAGAAKAVFKSSSIELASAGVTVEATKVDVKASAIVTMKGSKILLG